MRLHFKAYGGGEPLVLLHGLFGSSDNWLGVLPKLAEKFHVFAVDLRNHGQSPHSAAMSYALMADDLVEFLAERHLPGITVIGHSLGGKVAMQFALSHPDKVQKLVVADMAPRVYEPVHEPILAALLDLDLKSFHTRQEIEEALEPVVPSLVVRRFLLKNLGRDAGGGLYWKMNVPGLAENYSRLGEALTAAAPFEKPALFVRGGRSDYIQAEDEPLIRELFPKAEIQTIAQAAHWVHGDAPDEFVSRVLKFLLPV